MSKTTQRYGKPTLHGRISIDGTPASLLDPSKNYGIYQGHKYDTVCPVCSTNMVSRDGQWVCPLNGQVTQHEAGKDPHKETGAVDKRIGVANVR